MQIGGSAGSKGWRRLAVELGFAAVGTEWAALCPCCLAGCAGRPAQHACGEWARGGGVELGRLLAIPGMCMAGRHGTDLACVWMGGIDRASSVNRKLPWQPSIRGMQSSSTHSAISFPAGGQLAAAGRAQGQQRRAGACCWCLAAGAARHGAATWCGIFVLGMPNPGRECACFAAPAMKRNGSLATAEQAGLV